MQSAVKKDRNGRLDGGILVYVYVYMYVCMYVCMYVYRYVCMYVCNFNYNYIYIVELLFVRRPNTEVKRNENLYFIVRHGGRAFT